MGIAKELEEHLGSLAGALASPDDKELLTKALAEVHRLEQELREQRREAYKLLTDLDMAVRVAVHEYAEEA